MKGWPVGARCTGIPFNLGTCRPWDLSFSAFLARLRECQAHTIAREGGMGCQRRFFRFAGSISAPRRLLASRFLCRGCSIWNIIEYTLLAKLHLNSFARCASGWDSSITERKNWALNPEP